MKNSLLPILVVVSFLFWGCKENPWKEFDEISSIITFEKKISTGRAVDVFQMKNGEYIISNGLISPSFAKAIKLDQYGNIIDSLKIIDNKLLKRMILTSDEQIVFAGTQKQGGSGPFNQDRPIIARYNSDLSFESSFVISGQTMGAKNLKSLEGIVETQNKSLIFWGEYSPDLFGATSIFIGEIQKNYNFLNITDSLKNELTGYYAPLFINGGKVYAITDENHLLIISNGSKITKKIPLGGVDDEFLGLTVLSSGNIMISGLRNDVPFIETRDGEGKFIKVKNFTSTVYIDLVQDFDENVMLLGGTLSANTEQDIVLTKIHPTTLEKIGDDKVFKRKGYDLGASIIHTNDGGFMIAGTTGSNGPEQIYLIKTDSNGDVK